MGINILVILMFFLFVAGLTFLIPGIIGTVITNKVKHGSKVLRVLSIIAMVIGIGLCVLAILIPICVVLFRYT